MQAPRVRAVSALTAVGLTLAAVVLRLPSISTDGLVYDDAWVMVGATKASVAQLLSVSTMHPGYTAGLMGWSALLPSSTASLTLPAFIVGAATPAIVFLLFRRLGLQWWVSVAAAVLVLVAPAHVVYSGRIKPYVLETLAILVLAAGLGRLARRRWSVGMAALWVAGALVFATINAFAFIAVAVAAVVLVLHPAGDRLLRLAAMAVQGVCQLVYLLALQRSFDATDLEAVWGAGFFDGYVQLDGGPGALVREIGTHLARVGEVVVHERWLALGLVLVGLGGLAWRSWRGPHQVMARYLLALPLVAFVGAVAGRIPFGTIQLSPLTLGTRASLWLLPSLLAGAAFAVDDADRALAGRRPRARWAVVGSTVVATAAIVVSGNRYDADYPVSGAETAHQVVAARAGDGVAIILQNGRWSYAAVPGVDVEVIADSGTQVGFDAVLRPPAVAHWVAADWEASVAQSAVRADDVDWVVIVNGNVGILDDAVPVVEAELDRLGFRLTERVEAGFSEVFVWERPPA